MKKVLASLLAVMMLLMCIPLGAVSVSAASALSATPNPLVEYNYSDSVSVGTIRYIAQNQDSKYFNWNYWPSSSFGGYVSPGSECGTACISMALSYVGVDRTPKALLEAPGVNGYTNKMWSQQGDATSKAITRSTSAVASAMDDYINGKGKYSPLCVYIQPFSATSSMHWVLLVGKLDTNKYLALNPWHSAGTDATFVIQINGTTATYQGLTNPITSINQWYNPKAINVIKESFKSHCIVKVTNASTIKSLPCSKDTDPNSKDVESVKVGDEYEAIALHRNNTKTGNLWYEVKTKSGGTGYLFAGNTKFVKQLTDDVTVKNPVSPASIEEGDPFIIGGTISTPYQTITRVQAWVTSPGGLTDYLYGHHDNLSVTSYNLAGSAVDTMLTFGTLGVGIYEYRVRVRVDSYYAKDATTTATTYNDELYLDECASTFFVMDSTCNHSYDVVVINPTCDEGGYSTYTCKYCGYAYDDYYTDPLGCDYETTTYGPTCTEPGYTISVCHRCGNTVMENYVDPIEHWYVTETVPATCTKQGYTEYVCWYCEDYFVSDYVAALDHFYQENISIPPTCSSEGSVRYECIRDGCDEWYTKVLSRIEHEYEWTIIVQGTCTIGAEAIKTCVNCGDSYEQKFPAAGHFYKWAITVPRTCVTDGLLTYTCSNCDDSYTEPFLSNGHLYDNEDDIDCNECGEIRNNPDLPADAPAFVVESVTACEGDEITVAIRTQRNSGVVSLRLEVAYDADVLELISLEEGDFANVVLSPTTRNPFIANWADAVNPNNTTDGVVVLATFRVKEGAPLGKTEITLTYDPEDVYDQNFDNVGFRVENGYVEIVDYVPGDVNDDGRINNKDLGILQQYLAGFDVSVNQRASDVTADGRVNNKDLGILQQYLAGFEVELG